MLKFISECCFKDINDKACDKCHKETQGVKVHTCRNCADYFAEERYDAHGIFTGHWCDSCYDSSKYQAIESDDYSERLDKNF